LKLGRLIQAPYEISHFAREIWINIAFCDATTKVASDSFATMQGIIAGAALNSDALDPVGTRLAKWPLK
jgi:hypothetical protein